MTRPAPSPRSVSSLSRERCVRLHERGYACLHAATLRLWGLIEWTRLISLTVKCSEQKPAD